MVTIYESSEIEKLKQYISYDLYVRQRSSRHVCVPLNTTAYFMAFYWYDIKDMAKPEERVCLYCDEKDLVFIGDSKSCIDILKRMPEDKPPFHALAEFFFELTAGDVDEFERIENDINRLEDALITSPKPIKGTSVKIIMLRRLLLKMKRYYEQLGLVIDQLATNENGAIPSGILSRFSALSRRTDRLTNSVIHLREYITQVREAYQAQIDIEQNQIMRIFTVITAVFLPLTLIVGWYGMNFQMPEYVWESGYLYVMVLSAIVCVICILIFKRKKWF
jgi:magnesium transporter